MRANVENLVTAAEDENVVAKRVAEIEPSDYDDLMCRIDEVMELNEGAGPDPIDNPDKFGWLARASVVAEYYEKRAFEI